MWKEETDRKKENRKAETIKVSVRGNFAILHNFTFLNGWINLKVIFKIKKTLRKNISVASYCAINIFCTLIT